MFQGSIVWKGIVYSILMTLGKGLVSIVIYFDYFIKWFITRKPSPPRRTASTTTRADPQPTQQTTSKRPPHAIALLVGFAMISRGEIGFLIASLSQSSGTLTLRQRNGVGSSSSGEEIFLVIVWAVVICTIAGPIGVGIIVRKLRKGENSARYVGWI
jgi:Kef-type K+ transport system membrane component KefB